MNLWEYDRVPFERFLQAGAECLAAYEAWDPEGHEEFLGICRGADLPAVEVFSATNLTDVRDLTMVSDFDGHLARAEGCTMVLLPGALTKRGNVLGAQTWDLNPPDLDYVVAVHRQPDDGPETWSVTVAGATSLMGMNENGVSLGTTNIKTSDVQPGVPYLGILHKAIRAENREEALSWIEQSPRCGAHTYWVADETGASELECSAQQSVRHDISASLPQAVVQTNHCRSDVLCAMEAAQPNASTQARFARMTAIAAAGDHDEETLKAAFADRADGVDSINRYPEDDQGTATNACLIAEPATRSLWACRGPADRGAWTQLSFAGNK